MNGSQPFGNTPTGIDWCIKSLHPSDECTSVQGIPDGNATSTVLMNYQCSYTLSATPTATGTWDFNAAFLPHPVDFFSAITYDSVTTSRHVNFNNPQLAPASTLHADKIADFVSQCEQYRLAYSSVSGYFNGPSLANQGMISVAQVPTHPYKFACTTPTSQSAHTVPACGFLVNVYTANDMPTFDTAQSMPASYLGEIKDGFYAPTKLTQTSQKWRGQNDLVVLAGSANGTESGWLSNGYMPLVSSTGTAITSAWPHWDLTSLHESDLSTTLSTAVGQATTPMLNDNITWICGRGIDVTSTVTMYFRVGIEMRVKPSSVLAPQLHIAPRYDPLALQNYFLISRELKDGYPEDYNSAAKMWNAIKAALPTALGMLGTALGGPGGAAIGFRAGSTITKVGDTFATLMQRRNKDVASRDINTPLSEQGVSESRKLVRRKRPVVRKANRRLRVVASMRR